MTTIDNEKKLALYYYGELFDQYYNFIQIDNTSKENYDGLRDAINELHQTEYDGKYGATQAYYYVLNQLDKSYNNKFSNSKIIMITSTYEELIKNIAKFSFDSTHAGSFGDKQNKNTDKILYQLSLIKDYIYSSLKEIDNKLKEDLSHNDSSFINNRLEEMLYLLLSSLNDLIYRQDEYKKAIRVVKGLDIPRFDDVNIIDTVNESLKNWKVSRNGTLNNITRFINKLDNLIKAMYMSKNITNYDFYLMNRQHREWNDYINSSENAYSYREPYRR